MSLLSQSESWGADSQQHAQELDLDAEWLGAQTGAPVGCSHRIVRHLASGGMGHVFVAEHEFLGAQAAVKVPRYADAAGRMVLESEAKLLAKLEHPNIVRALDVGQLADGRMYLLMEHACGVELGAWLDAHSTVPFERCLTVLKQVAAAVDYLHLKGIVHGDIKPANILVDGSADDFVKLVDFGIASTTTRSERRGVLGTPAYMAPEQARGDAWGSLSDVYAVAALSLQMLTGHPPHAYRTAQDVLTAVLTQPARTPSALGLKVPNLDAVFERGLHPEPGQRFPRASAFVNALAEALIPVAQVGVPSVEAVRDQLSAGEARAPELKVKGRSDAAALAGPGIAAMSCLSWQLGTLCGERMVRRLAAGLIAAVFAFSVLG